MLEKSITVLAHFYFKPDYVQKGQELLTHLEKVTQEEPGCLFYFLHQNNQDLTHFVMIENWENQTFLQQHLNMKHLEEARDVLEPMLSKPIEVQFLHQCTQK